MRLVERDRVGQRLMRHRHADARREVTLQVVEPEVVAQDQELAVAGREHEFGRIEVDKNRTRIVHRCQRSVEHRSRERAHVVDALPLTAVGKPDKKALAAEHVNDDDLQSMLREQQVDDIKDVKTATLEANGILSVIKTEQSREAQKGDLRDLLPKKPKQEK